LIAFERKGDGLARGGVEGFQKRTGGVPHTPGRVRLHAGRCLVDVLRNGVAQLLGEQNRGADAQSEMSAVHDPSLQLNGVRSVISISLTLA
jgi:hypothetical protein